MKTKTHKTAYILISIILLLCLLSILCIMLYPKLNREYTAYIYINGELYADIPLHEITSPYSFRISSEDGHYNEIHVESGAISITSADCPDKVCVKQGQITNNLLPITCLPHHLVIELKPTASGLNMPDAITH